MTRLDLSNNQIEDLTPRLNINASVSRCPLFLTGNPLSSEAIEEQIPILRERWKEVIF